MEGIVPHRPASLGDILLLSEASKAQFDSLQRVHEPKRFGEMGEMPARSKLRRHIRGRPRTVCAGCSARLRQRLVVRAGARHRSGEPHGDADLERLGPGSDIEPL